MYAKFEQHSYNNKSDKTKNEIFTGKSYTIISFTFLGKTCIE